MNLRKTTLNTAMIAVLGIGNTAQANVLTFEWQGLFAMQNLEGSVIFNDSAPYYYDTTWGNGGRTPVSGTLSYDTNTGTGTATVSPFSFLSGSAPFAFDTISLQAIGDGFGDPTGTLMMANALFNWNGSNGMPASLVLDAAGLMGAIGDGLTVGDSVNQSNYGVVTSATDAADTGIPKNSLSTYPVGGVPIGSTSWDTTPACNTSGSANNGNCLDVNPIGVFPLLAGAQDANGNFISGSPMMDGQFSSSNFSLDFTSLTLQTSAVPVPAAVWLFGSGLVGLLGMTRRRKAT